MHTLVQSLRLIRILNCLFASCGVFVGAYLTLDAMDWWPVTLVSMAVFFVCGGGNVFNDYNDISIDRAAHPSRPLASGKLSRRFALRLGVGLNGLALVLPFLVNWQSTAIVWGAVGLLFIYNFGAKRYPLIGNVIIALLAGGTFVSGGLAVSPEEAFDLPGPLIPAVFAFLLHLMREIVKDIQDLDSDRTGGLRTLPIVCGARISMVFVLVLSLGLAAATYWPYWMEWFGYRYFYLAGYGVVVPLLVMSVIGLAKPTSQVIGAFSALLKVTMAVGLIALIMA